MKISKILLFHFFLSVAATGATAQSQEEQCADLIFKADYHRTYLLCQAAAEQGFAAALLWFRRAAVQGYADAQYQLGTFYEDGLGVAEDFVLAHMWYQIASEKGNQDALRARQNASGKKNIQQVRALELARQCMYSNYKQCK